MALFFKFPLSYGLYFSFSYISYIGVQIVFYGHLVVTALKIVYMKRQESHHYFTPNIQCCN